MDKLFQKLTSRKKPERKKTTNYMKNDDKTSVSPWADAPLGPMTFWKL